MSEPVIEVRHLSKSFGTHVVLRDVDFTVNAGDVTCIIGASGSGKSTLLRCINLLETPTNGKVLFHGSDITAKGSDPCAYRAKVCMVFQSFNLVPTLDARANIELPLHLAGQKPDRRWLSMIIDVLGIGNRLKHRPQEMSGGQQQRVAVARALASKPAVIVADEPTGNLDSASSREVLQLLRAAVDQLGQSVIMVTHDQNAALIADRVLVMRDGKIRADLTKPTEAQLSEAAR